MRRVCTLAAWVALVVQVCPHATGAVFEGRYRLALGGADYSVDDATVWVYAVGWGRLERFEGGVVRDGRVNIVVNSEDVPFPDPWTFLVAIEFPDGRWFRGPDFPSEDNRSVIPAGQFIEGFDPYFRDLGHVESETAGIPTVVLPAFVERRITLLNEDGSPLVGREVPIDIYVTRKNHCGVHRGLIPDYRGHNTVETTDSRGQVVFFSQPGIPLYLDVPSWPRTSPEDSQWVWREIRAGIQTDSAARIAVRERWNSVERRALTFEVHHWNGEPAVDHRVLWLGAGASCGFFGLLSDPADPTGRLTIEVSAEVTSEIRVLLPGDDESWSDRVVMTLSEDQRGQLVRDGTLTVALPSSR